MVVVILVTLAMMEPPTEHPTAVPVVTLVAMLVALGILGPHIKCPTAATWTRVVILVALAMLMLAGLGFVIAAAVAMPVIAAAALPAVVALAAVPLETVVTKLASGVASVMLPVPVLPTLVPVTVPVPAAVMTMTMVLSVAPVGMVVVVPDTAGIEMVGAEVAATVMVVAVVAEKIRRLDTTAGRGAWPATVIGMW